MTTANVTPIESKQPAPAGAKFIITASIDGFPVSIEAEGRADALRALVDRLKAIGAEPPSAKTAEPTKAAAADSCPHHPGRKLKASTARPGTFFCTAKDAETGEYCKFKA